MRYIPRKAEPLLKELYKSYPVIIITGPRQSGKTTLAKQAFPHKVYRSLEDLDQRAFAQEDPKAFLDLSGKKGLIIDEIQRVPELFSYIQGRVDSHQKMGEFVLTGSHSFSLLSKATQSLAGRVGLLELLPFCIEELNPKIQKKSLEEVLKRGFYPTLYSRKIQPHLWYEDYVKTYLERDVRQLTNIKDLSLFRRFLGVCAARSGQLINYNEMGNDLGLDTRTLKSWLSILEASYVLFFLQPYHKSFSKKIVKTPKLYFYDSGLLSYLLKLNLDSISISPFKGALFEGMIISDYIKEVNNTRKNISFYFWRNNIGIEIDLLIEKGTMLHAFEIKSSSTLHSSFFRNLKLFKKYAGSKLASAQVVYGGKETQMRSTTKALSWISKMPL